MNDHHTYPPSVARSSQSPPTKPQLKLLRELASERGETFAAPRTVQQARAEIMRLKARPPMRRADRRRENLAISRQMATGHRDAAAVDHDYETQDYGSSATWA